VARIRTIKPDFFRHEGLFEAERESGLPLRVAFAGLWTAADKEGRFRWSPRQLKLDCLPFDDVDFSRVLDALATRGFIVRYACDGKEYGCIPSWKQHQIINNRESESSLPEPNENNELTRAPRVDDACPTRLKYAQGEGKGREGKEDAAPSGAPSEKSEEADLFERGKSVLGRNAGGLIASLLKAKKGSVPMARAAIEQASTKHDPREYIGRVIRGPMHERHSVNDQYAGQI
jgi:hypothetical protein